MTKLGISAEVICPMILMWRDINGCNTCRYFKGVDGMEIDCSYGESMNGD